MGFLASDARKSAGFLYGLDPLEGVDVVTSVVTDPASTAPERAIGFSWPSSPPPITSSTMTRVKETPLDQAARAAEKQRSRDEDARALASGEKTVEQLREENEVFARLAPRTRVDIAASRSLG